MPTSITIGYGDRAGYDRTDSSTRATTDALDGELKLVGVDGEAGVPVQISFGPMP